MECGAFRRKRRDRAGERRCNALEDMRKYQLHCPECGREFLWDLDINEQKKRKIDRKKAEYEGMIADMKKHNDPMVLVWSQEYKGLQARLVVSRPCIDGRIQAVPELRGQDKRAD